jgi:hypothetical protein
MHRWMRMASLVAAVCVMVLVAQAAEPSEPPEGFEPVFNGKDLSGMKPRPNQKMEDLSKQWVYKEGGVLEFNPTGKRGEMTLWTEKEYGDVTLMFDWRWIGPASKIQRPHLDPATGDEKKGPDGKVIMEEIDEYDSGIYLRGSSKAQVNMWNWPAGSGEVYGYRTDKKQPVEVRAGVTPKKKMDKPIGEWNHMVITIKGDRLTVAMNGEEVVTNAQLPGVPSKGPLAFQDHGQGFQLRNVYVKELK